MDEGGYWKGRWEEDEDPQYRQESVDTCWGWGWRPERDEDWERLKEEGWGWVSMERLLGIRKGK